MRRVFLDNILHGEHHIYIRGYKLGTICGDKSTEKELYIEPVHGSGLKPFAISAETLEPGHIKLCTEGAYSDSDLFKSISSFESKFRFKWDATTDWSNVAIIDISGSSFTHLSPQLIDYVDEETVSIKNDCAGAFGTEFPDDPDATALKLFVLRPETFAYYTTALRHILKVSDDRVCALEAEYATTHLTHFGEYFAAQADAKLVPNINSILFGP
jgi:hypothetical protein